MIPIPLLKEVSTPLSRPSFVLKAISDEFSGIILCQY
jgi:hypothetical protein